ncbi:hypothetical protein QO200_02925 [Flavobacterium sp. Arc3]|jgi:hypothetical protein|uniref:hypothetical protein n=1 Tax=Flavobacterium sp. Arc3 TaxID=3046686 RepID=UPI00352DF7BE
MKKIYFLFLFISASVLYSQNTNSSFNAVKFKADSLDLNFNHFEANKISFDFSKLESPFSLYNPMPGLNAFNINSRNYYSMDNTNRLLGNEMKNYKKDPIFPEVKKETLGEAIFSGIIDSIFD